MNVPKLRFKEFNDEWSYQSLSKYVNRITTKNKNNESNLVLTISAQYGLVDQTNFFNRSVSSSNLTGYYLLNNGDFAYNKSYSNGYPWGAVKRLNKYNQGVVSSLYICFKPNDLINSDFLEQYFETNKWYQQISEVSVEGARNHGLLNIAVNDFFNTKHYIPSIKEQEKISNFLSLLDKKIELQSKKIEDLKLFKKGLIDKVIDNLTKYKEIQLGELGETYSGLSGKTKEDFEKGESHYIPFVAILNNKINTNLLPIVRIDKNETQNEVRQYDLFFNTSSETLNEVGLCSTLNNDIKNTYLNSFCFGYRIRNLKEINNEYLNILLHSSIFRKKISVLGQGFTRVNISKNKLMEIKVLVPSFREQLKIVSIINMESNKLSLEENKLLKLQQLKKGLMQSMFV